MTKTTDKYYPVYIAIILILLIPALFINLGLLPLIADEATRAIVSLEMEFSGKLIAPTISGEYYFNKPPLYNWILLCFFKLSGNHSEWMIRLPALISLLLFGFLIYISVTRYTTKRIAFVSALAFITSGRILFYDSMLGLIDLTFSLLIFLNFILIYHFAKKKNYWILFIISYMIASVTFLMKGLPAILFQGLTIISALLFFKDWRKLFRIPHLAGILVFGTIVGGYYILLWKENPDISYFQTLITQSTQRTFVEYGIWKTILHLFTFPPEQFYQLLPWSILTVLMLKKSFYSNVRENQFLSYLALIFLVNIPVYWISVESYPRYLFSLYPLLLIILVHQYYSLNLQNKWRKVVDCIIYGSGIAGIPVGLYFFFRHTFTNSQEATLIVSILSALVLSLLYFGWKNRSYRLEFLIVIIILVRIGFNLFILPERYYNSRAVIQKQMAENVIQLVGDNKLEIHEQTAVSHESIFYMERKYGKIIPRYWEQLVPGSFYIFQGREIIRPEEIILLNFETRWENTPLRLSKIRE